MFIYRLAVGADKLTGCVPIRGLVRNTVDLIHKVRDIDQAVVTFQEQEFIEQAALLDLDLGQGVTTMQLTAPQSLFFQVLEETCNRPLKDDKDLLKVLKEYSAAKMEYDKVAEALYDVDRVGYGIVPPRLEEMVLEEPKVLKAEVVWHSTTCQCLQYT